MRLTRQRSASIRTAVGGRSQASTKSARIADDGVDNLERRVI
jgi:hypothetical protein